MKGWHWAVFFLVLVGGLGFFISSPTVLVWVSHQSVAVSALVFYTVLFIFATLAGFLGTGGKWSVRYSVAALLVWYAFGVLNGWANNPFSVQITGARVTAAELGLEESLTIQVWAVLTSNPFLLRVLTYVVSPILAISAAFALVLSARKDASGREDIGEELREFVKREV
jgi:hypothetical protein